MRQAVFAFAVVAGLAFIASAQAAELKVGVVNPAKVLEEAPQAEAARKKLEEEFAPRQQELVETQKELRGQQERLERDSAIMSESERRKLQRDIMTLKRDVRRTEDEFQEDLNLRRNDVLGKLQRRVAEVIHNMAREDKFDLILTDGFLYASDNVDITDQVIRRLEELDSQEKTKAGAKDKDNN